MESTFASVIPSNVVFPNEVLNFFLQFSSNMGRNPPYKVVDSEVFGAHGSNLV